MWALQLIRETEIEFFSISNFSCLSLRTEGDVPEEVLSVLWKFRTGSAHRS